MTITYLDSKRLQGLSIVTIRNTELIGSVVDGGLASISGWEQKQGIKITSAEAGKVLNTITVQLKKTGTPSGNIQAVIIQGSNPQTSPIASSNIITSDSLTTSYVETTFTFSNYTTVENDYIMIIATGGSTGNVVYIKQSSGVLKRVYANNGDTTWTGGSGTENGVIMNIFSGDVKPQIPIPLTGLKSYWKFNEASGTIVNQAGTVGSDVSLGTSADLSTVTGATYGATGIIGNALSFDGVNDFAAVASSVTDYNFLHADNAEFTVNMWYKINTLDTDNYEPIMTTGSEAPASAKGAFGLFWDDRDASVGERSIRVQFNYNLLTQLTTEYTPALFLPDDNNWHMLTFRYDENGTTTAGRLRVDDGVDTNFVRSANPAGAGNAVGKMTVASWVGGVTFFTPIALDEFSIWNRQLSDKELESLYNAGAGKELNEQTNIQTNSIFEQTDTNTRHWYDGNNWITQPTFETDFSSSTGWVSSNSSRLAVASNQLNYYNAGYAKETLYYDLTSVSDEAWVLRFKTTFTGTASSNEPAFGFQINNVQGAGIDTSCAALGVWWYIDRNNTWRRIYTTSKATGTGVQGNIASPEYFGNFDSGTPYFIEITRASSTSLVVKIFATDAYDTPIAGGTLTVVIPAGTTGLRYLTAGHYNQGSGYVGVIDDLKFYNGVTSV